MCVFFGVFEDPALKGLLISETQVFLCPFSPPLVSIVPFVRTLVVAFVLRFLFVRSFAQEPCSFVSEKDSSRGKIVNHSLK